MKAYLYNPENGLYEGEAFEDPRQIPGEDGITPLAPPAYEHGQVPVFDRRYNSWAVIPISIARQLLTSPADSAT